MSGFQPSDGDTGATLSGGPLGRWKRMVLVALAAAGLALAFAWLATPRYMGETHILIGSSEPFSTESPLSAESGATLLDEEGLASRMSVPFEPYFSKPFLIAGATFVVVLLVMAVIALAQELSLRRATRRAASEGAEPVARETFEDSVHHDAPDERPEKTVVDRPMQTQEQPIMRNLFARRAAVPEHTDLLSEAPVVLEDDAVETGAGEVEEGRIGVERAAEMLVTGGATRAIFVSPEGDEGAAAAVLVARQVADAGLRVLLIDLTTSGAASLPMLDGLHHPGITNLLASEGNFTDTIHVDHYSDCAVMPIGTADPARAMKSAARLPIIVKSLTNAYDVVVIECGASDAEGISRLVADGTEIMVSAVEPDGEVAASLHELEARGYGRVSLVSPGLSPIE